MAILKRRRRALVLDDDLSMQKLVSMLLKRQGFRVDVVGSGGQAIEAIDRNDYAVILLDLMMPHEGGMTVIAHLRKENAGLLQRVILLTATPDSVLNTVARDVFAVVKKPFQAETLIAAVGRVNEA